METAGVEPTPPRCKRGALPPELRPRRCGRMESNHHSTRHRVYSAGSSPLLSVRIRGDRPDSNRYREAHNLGCSPTYTTATTKVSELR
jgi:hypothetical protein